MYGMHIYISFFHLINDSKSLKDEDKRLHIRLLCVYFVKSYKGDYSNRFITINIFYIYIFSYFRIHVYLVQFKLPRE